MEPRLKAWFVFPGGTKFGEGRAELLRLIEAEGSLKGAVERMGMSYRAAWGYLRELEAAAGFRIVERPGPGPAGGTRLTDAGRAFLESFERYRSRVEAASDRAYADAFPARRRNPRPKAGTRRRSR